MFLPASVLPNKTCGSCPELEGRNFSERTTKLIRRTYDCLYSKERHCRNVAKLLAEANTGKRNRQPNPVLVENRHNSASKGGTIYKEPLLALKEESTIDTRVLDVANMIFIAPSMNLNRNRTEKYEAKMIREGTVQNPCSKQNKPHNAKTTSRSRRKRKSKEKTSLHNSI